MNNPTNRMKDPFNANLLFRIETHRDNGWGFFRRRVLNFTREAPPPRGKKPDKEHLGAPCPKKILDVDQPTRDRDSFNSPLATMCSTLAASVW